MRPSDDSEVLGPHLHVVARYVRSHEHCLAVANVGSCSDLFICPVISEIFQFSRPSSEVDTQYTEICINIAYHIAKPSSN